MHARIWRMLAPLLASGDREIRRYALGALLSPMDSVRYFELEFAWRSARSLSTGRYLDVSSPRLFPLSLLKARPGLRADLVNPDRRDLDITRRLAVALGLAGRSNLHANTVNELAVPESCYDLVTCISVIEHIPAPGDARAVERLWSMVRLGGKLVVTVPVAREAFEEYLDVNEYGLLASDPGGWTFGQRFYDDSSLTTTFLDRIARPARVEIFGETRPGVFVEDRARKAAGTNKPWREPYSVALDWARHAAIPDLPGWGVVALEFVRVSR